VAQQVQFEGQIHEFPDDFTPQDIQKALASLPKQAPQSYNGGWDWKPGMAVPQVSTPTNLSLTQRYRSGEPGIADPSGYPAPGGEAADTPSEAGGRLTNFSRPFASLMGAARVGESAAAAMPGPPALKAAAGVAAGAGTYLGIDGVLHRLQDYLQGGPPPSFKESLDSSVEQGLTNIAGEQLLNFGMRAAKPVVTKGLQQLIRLSPTVSQALASPELDTSALGKTLRALSLQGRIPGVMEDLFTPGAKEAAIQNSATVGKQMVAEKASQLSGKALSTVTDPEMLGRTVQTDVGNAWDAYLNKSNAQALSARLVAEGAPQQVVSPTLQSTYQALGVPIPAGVGTVVKGPISLNETLETANKYVKGIDQSTLPPTNDEAAGYRTAQQLIGSTNAQFDPQTGRLLRADPVGFGEAWDAKQNFGNNTSFSQTDVNLTPTERLNKALFHSMNNDIEAGIPAWDTPGKDAMKGWKAAKATVEERNLLFDPEGATVPTLKKIIDNANSPLPQVEATLADPQALQRALTAGEIDFKAGKGTNGPTGELSLGKATASKKDWAAARLQSAWSSGESVDDQGNPVLNIQKVQNAFNDPRMLNSNKLLFNSEGQSNINQLFKTIALTQSKPNGSWLPKVTAVRAGIRIAPALIGYGSGGASGALEGAASTVGAELGFSALTKLMTNPKTARILIHAAGGQALGMSEQMAARQISSAIEGLGLAVVDRDGTKKKGYLQEGQFQSNDQ
jgi:hypothetical protein